MEISRNYEMAAKMASYGLSHEQVADILGRDIRTIEQWLKNIGKKSEIFHLWVHKMKFTELLIIPIPSTY
jgi:transposase